MSCLVRLCYSLEAWSGSEGVTVVPGLGGARGGGVFFPPQWERANFALWEV